MGKSDWRELERGMADDELFEYRLKKTVAVVEATHTEQHFLWMQESHQSGWDDAKHPHPKMTWEQANPGRMVPIGKIGGRDVWMTIFFYVIEGQYVLFHELTSQACDHTLVEPWFAKAFGAKGWPTYDRGHRTATFDAMNFHNARSAIKQAAGIPE